MSDSVTERTDRDDFQATRDPAVLESRRPGEAHLLSYQQLYRLWERQQWATQDIDFTQDRIDWHERIPEEERFQRMYGLSLVLHRRAEGGRGARADDARRADRGDAHLPLHADRRRGAPRAFFNRFYDEVGVLEAGDLQGRLEETSEHVNPEFDGSSTRC